MHVMNHNWSATKQLLHPQSVAGISRHSVLSGQDLTLWDIVWVSSSQSHRWLVSSVGSSTDLVKFVSPPQLAELCDCYFLSFCEQDNSRTHLRMSTKHGRRGQEVTL